MTSSSNDGRVSLPHILLFDHDFRFASLAAQRIGRALRECRLSWAASAAEVRRQLREGCRPDLILMRAPMAEREGQLLEDVRGDRSFGDVPLVVLEEGEGAENLAAELLEACAF